MARILIVDDEPRLLKEITRCLERDGHVAVPVESLSAAWGLLTVEQFDVAVVDLRLGDGSGLNLLRRLRATQPRCARLLVSGYLDLAATLGAINDSEVCRVITKPFTPAELQRAVKESLERTRQAMSDTEGPGERQCLEELLQGPGLQLALQPVVDAGSGEVVGYEGLMRATDSVHGGPAGLLAAAQRHRMLRHLTRAVVDRAAGWLLQLPPRYDFFLNLHPEELSDMGELVELLAPLAPHAGQVVLDITGQHSERWGSVLAPRLDHLRSLGFRFALDDVGAGHQSLLLLAEVEPAFIKADRSIVGGIDVHPHKRRVLEMLARFAQVSGARLVAEGVETAAEAAVLSDAGVALLQGYHFGRPRYGIHALA